MLSVIWRPLHSPALLLEKYKYMMKTTKHMVALENEKKAKLYTKNAVYIFACVSFSEKDCDRNILIRSWA